MSQTEFEQWQADNVREQDMILLTELSAYDSNEPETVIPEPVKEPVKVKERKAPLQAVTELFTGTSKEIEPLQQQKKIEQPQPIKRAGKLSEYGKAWEIDRMNVTKDLFRQPGDYQRSYQVT